MKEKSILDSLLYKILKYLYYFLVTNLLFLVSNSLFLFVLFIFPLSLSNILLYSLSLIPMGFSISAMCYSMRKMWQEKELRPIGDYVYGYKLNLRITLKFWLLQLGIGTIFLVDVLYFLDKDQTIIAILFGLGLLINLAVSLAGFPILTTFEVKLKNLYIISFYTWGKFFLGQLFNLITLLSFGIILYAYPSEMFLFVFSVSCYFIMKQNDKILSFLNQQFSIES
ncbi:DUF624 domain-containing protein [Desemzia sp. RIT804]|uniref:DUF624 domain-containing protein n=1 Tax=Desemzia sp. RIT 804 TaxID=2810209 RepID=UPI00195214C9|nr:DUF624 domain-containing protein [Desemzia sp. RIT 804]MBM6614487.1 DUF624 domain-containing protein [Desemzia sp. RIT 804]